MMGSLAIGAGLTAFNNYMSEYHANQAQKRQLELMERQNDMNRANALSAYATQVQGMRMAGLNPASLEGGVNPNVSAPVSQGAAPKGENVELDPMVALLKAQTANIEADTRKKNEETGNVKQDTSLKLAETLFTGKNANKVDEEVTRIRNFNDAYTAENENLSVFGQAMAEKWTGSPWFEKLSPDTKESIKQIADGSVQLSVGGIEAMKKVVAMQSDLSDSDRKLVQNAFDNAITESVFNDKSVMEAIVKEPEFKQNKLKAEISKLNAELPEIRAKVANLMSDLQTKKLSREQMQAELQAFKRNDLGYLKSQGEYGKWLEGYAEEMLMRIFPMLTGGLAVRGASGKSKPTTEPSMISTPGSADFRQTISDINKRGVQSFHF